MTDEELKNFNNPNCWDKCIKLLEEHIDMEYGSIKKSVKLSEDYISRIVIEIHTGGWSENEEIIEQISNTLFWAFWWQESRRGGHYKFAIIGGTNYDRYRKEIIR